MQFWRVREKDVRQKEMDVRETDISHAPLAELTQRPRSTPALPKAWISSSQ